MKNLLLLATLLLISTGGYLNAQCPDTVRTNGDGTCLFLKWKPGNAPNKFIITVADTFGNTFTYRGQDAQLGNHYAIDDSIQTCSENGLKAYSGAIILLGDTCFYKRGDLPKDCPDDAIISVNDECIFMLYDSVFPTATPDSIILNNQSYSFYGLQVQPEKVLMYRIDTLSGNAPCDTSMMVKLNDTLIVNGGICTYTDGLLPITILAFDYQNDNDQVTLSWKVNSDEPTRQLYLQKSYDGVDWMNVYEQNMDDYTIGQVMDGHYKDASIEQPRLYYRLYIAGYNQDGKYSNILPVTMKNQVINNLFYQSGTRSIMIKAGQNFTGEMHLINAQGQNMMTKKVQVLKNSYQEIAVDGQLTPGIYFVKFDNGLIPPTKIFIDN